ncbi:hypothetical protein CsatB_006182 [Cannabis sativa]
MLLRLAYEYGGRGAFLALIDIKDNFEIRRRALKLGSPDVISIVADVTKVEDCKKFIDEAVHHFGQLDHLVNNAGIVILSKFEDIDHISNHKSIMASKAALINFCETLRNELGSTIGITIVTPGLIGTKMTREQDIKLRLLIPEESAEGCAKANVRSVCRGESYLMEPRWLWWLFPARMIFPDLIDCCNSFLLNLIDQNSSTKQNC